MYETKNDTLKFDLSFCMYTCMCRAQITDNFFHSVITHFYEGLHINYLINRYVPMIYDWLLHIKRRSTNRYLS